MKELIDKFFKVNYDKLIGITKLKITYFERNIDAETLVSNSYLYVIDKIGKIKEEEIPTWVVGYINTELSLYNSKTLRKEAVSSGDEQCPDIINPYNFINEYEKRDFADAFKNTLTRLEQIVWDVYYQKGMYSAGDLASHFDIDRTSAWQMKVEIIKKLKEYVSTQE